MEGIVEYLRDKQTNTKNNQYVFYLKLSAQLYFNIMSINS
jgi:hypothetical protein